MVGYAATERCTARSGLFIFFNYPNFLFSMSRSMSFFVIWQFVDKIIIRYRDCDDKNNCTLRTITANEIVKVGFCQRGTHLTHCTIQLIPKIKLKLCVYKYVVQNCLYKLIRRYINLNFVKQFLKKINNEKNEFKVPTSMIIFICCHVQNQCCENNNGEISEWKFYYHLKLTRKYPWKRQNIKIDISRNFV